MCTFGADVFQMSISYWARARIRSMYRHGYETFFIWKKLWMIKKVDFFQIVSDNFPQYLYVYIKKYWDLKPMVVGVEPPWSCPCLPARKEFSGNNDRVCKWILCGADVTKPMCKICRMCKVSPNEANGRLVPETQYVCLRSFVDKIPPFLGSFLLIARA